MRTEIQFTILGFAILFSSQMAAMGLGTTAESLTIHTTYHLLLSQEHQEFENTPAGGESSDRLNYAFKQARIIGKADISDRVHIFMRYSILKNQLQRYHLYFDITDNLKILAGLQKARVFGWHRRISNGLLAIESSYVSSAYRPFSDSLMLEVEYKHLNNKFTIQLAEDYINCATITGDSCVSNNRLNEKNQKNLSQPALITEWTGNWNGFMPLLQLASYDLSKSYSYAVGFRFVNSFIDLHADYVEDHRANYVAQGASRQKVNSTLRGYTIHSQFPLNSFRPYLHYSSFDIDSDSGSSPRTLYNGSTPGGKTIGAGCYYENFGEYARPYVSIESRITDKQYTIGQSRELQQTNIHLGLLGSF